MPLSHLCCDASDKKILGKKAIVGIVFIVIMPKFTIRYCLIEENHGMFIGNSIVRLPNATKT